MTDEMLDLARANAAQAGASNVEFLKGTIEDIPLPDGSVDVVISNCVINLSVDKPKVIAEMFRVLNPGGRIGISDVVAEDHLSVDAAGRTRLLRRLHRRSPVPTGIPRRPRRRRLHQRNRPIHPPGRRWHAQRDHQSHQTGQVRLIDSKLTTYLDVLVVGAGRAGLAPGMGLRHAGLSFMIVYAGDDQR